MVRQAITWIGGLALLAATLVDTIAVIGRHIGLPLTGSIELMQAAVLVSGGIALLVATLDAAHARVRLVVDRLPPKTRLWADRLSDSLTLLFFALLLAGSAWIAWDLRHGYEQSELLGVPWGVLRLIAIACLTATCLVLGWRIVRRPE